MSSRGRGGKPLVIFQSLPVVLRHLRGERPRAEVSSGSGIAEEHLLVLEYRPGRPARAMRLDTLDALLRYYRVDLARLGELLAAAERDELETHFRTKRKPRPANGQAETGKQL